MFCLYSRDAYLSLQLPKKVIQFIVNGELSMISRGSLENVK